MKQASQKWLAVAVILTQLSQLVPGVARAQGEDALKPGRPGHPGHPGQPGHVPPPVGPRPPQPDWPDLEGARREGMSDGSPDGAREGRERGREAGTREGRENGRREGYQICLERRQRESYDFGYAEGIRAGSADGNTQGQLRGYSEGQSSGSTEGQRDGDQRAKRDARRESEVPAREQGRQEANRSDALNRGALAGAQAGEARARQTARDVDYPKGREAYRVQRSTEPVSREVGEEFSSQSILEKNADLDSALPLAEFSESLGFRGHGASPDYRYSHERRRYADPSLQRAYSDGYRSGYQGGFYSEYESEYRRAERLADQIGRDEGCRQAQYADVRGEFISGRHVGYRRGYDESYEQAYRLSYRQAYDPAFAQSSQSTYRDRYSGYYSSFFEDFRSIAYAERTKELYDSGFVSGEQENYNRSYPGLAKQEFDRGVRDETTEFAMRPIRFIEMGFTEQFEDSIVEPGEKIGFWFFIRNYADQAMPSNELRFEVETSGQGLIPLRQSDVPSSLIPARGAIRAKGAVPVVVSESALGKPVSATVRVFWRGTLLGSKSYLFQVRSRATIDLVERPSLREGLETVLRFKIQNNSTQTISGPVHLELRSDSRQIELVQSTAELPALAPGESREASFTVMGRTDRDQLEIPLAITVSDGSRKRVALRDFSGSMPVINDYRVKLLQGADGLRGSGVARLSYRIRNVSSRFIFGALEIHARVRDSQGREITGARWIGFNPQFLLPLERGEQLQFVIPVVLPQGLSGGMVELEVRENGLPVVIHQARF